MKKKENVGIFPTMSSSMSAKLFQHKIYAIEHLSNISSKSATTLQTTNTKIPASSLGFSFNVILVLGICCIWRKQS